MEKLQPSLRFPEFKGEIKRKKLSEVALIGRGKSKHRPRDAEFLYGGKYPFVQTGDVRNADLYLTNYTNTYSEAGLKQSKLWNENTLCITIAANIAETTILKIKACFPDSIIGLIPNEKDATVLFIKYQFDKFKLDIQKLSQGVAQANLNQEKISNIEFNFPSLPEQQKIASFLTALDEKLTLLKEKKNKLEQYKKGVMQKIFSQELRFKDDASTGLSTGTGNDYPEWEEKRLGEIIIESIEKTKSSGQHRILSSTAKGLFNQDEYFTRDIASKDNSGYKILKINQLVFSPQNLWLGNINVNINFEIGIVSPSYKIYSFNYQLTNTKYFYYFLKTPKMLFEYEQSSVQGASIVRRNLDLDKFLDIHICLPTIKEQSKIANFLTSVDDKIEVVNQQIKNTEEYKKGLLQGMFC
jgi:type I restriction enzyme S subunit